MARKSEVLDACDILRQLQTGLSAQAKRPNLYAYSPHEKQAIFHKSLKKKKLYIGGNRSGKSTGGIVEDIYWLRGNHPYRHLPEGPIRGRVVGVDFINGIQKIILPEFQRWMPPSLLKNGSWEDSYSKELRTLTLANGSFVEFMSYDQDTDKFAGTSRHFTHFDEEPPQHIYNECLARLVDTNGDFWITMTPIEGLTWIFDTLYTPGIEDKDSDIEVITVDMTENPYINKEAAESFLKGLSKEERAAREHGTFVQLGGRVYKTFSPETHVVPTFIPPKEWEWYVSLDHGFNNPTAVLWHAVSPENQIVTFAEHYASEMIIDEHAKAIHAINAALGKLPDTYVCDPALAQRQGVTGTSIQTEYAMRGIYLALGNNDVTTGVAKVQQYLRIDPKRGRPFWTVTENCVNLVREMQRLRWKTWSSRAAQFNNNKQETIHKKDDHASDALRYFMSMLPDLSPEQLGDPGIDFKKFDGPAPVEGKIDDVLARMVVEMHPQTSWNTKYGNDLGGLEYDV